MSEMLTDKAYAEMMEHVLPLRWYLVTLTGKGIKYVTLIEGEHALLALVNDLPWLGFIKASFALIEEIQISEIDTGECPVGREEPSHGAYRR